MWTDLGLVDGPIVRQCEWLDMPNVFDYSWSVYSLQCIERIRISIQWISRFIVYDKHRRDQSREHYGLRPQQIQQ
jgi:hypothetical protein